MAPIVDIHTHIYPPAYLRLLSSRDRVPYVYQPTASLNGSSPAPRLIILPSDDDASLPQSSRGRPIDSSYSSIEAKIAFMDTHSISASVISLANPWLDWLPTETAASEAHHINDDVEALCAEHPGRLFHFAALPLSAPLEAIVAEIRRIATLPYAKGLILGTTGLGAGLDDAGMAPLWSAIEESGLLVFVHPHYGLPSTVFGPRQAESGHVLPLALGFPLETTIAFVRMYVAGVFAEYPRLQILLAHAGGAVPFLAGRVESCMLHERAFRDANGKMKLMKGIWEVLKENIWLDAVIYSSIGVKAALETVGHQRVLWGTDHPFFPPIGEEEASAEWMSVRMNVDAVKEAFGIDRKGAEDVLGSNSVKLLSLGL